ncbi:ATP-binding cassette sub-family A member 3-like [Stegodyphus dumicola]|uniref:ATP-binding cassette sub-family A member 3-like n=1 Tax=Stegodyphus dumicola TaxID=202533 RepID=UPI0015B042DD|nr:ATP-binding cassette sub-family A member 3-like [Stegodyphus dumicola]
MGKFSHIILLIYKNIKIQFHHPWIIILRILIPVLCMLFLILLRNMYSVESNTNETLYESYNISGIAEKDPNATFSWQVYYSPKSSFLDRVMNDVARKLNITSIGFENEQNLVSDYLKSTSDVLAGIVFDQTLKHGIHSSGLIKYAIRPQTVPGHYWFVQSTDEDKKFQHSEQKASIWGTNYMLLDFLPLQHATTTTLMENLLTDLRDDVDTSFSIAMQRFPQPPYKYDTFYSSPEYYFTVAICLSFLYPAANIAKSVVHEKERHLKEAMRTMGLANMTNWLSWYFSHLILLGFSNVLMTIMLCSPFTKNGAIFNSSNPLCIFIWLMVYASSLVAFCFFITTLFSRTSSAVGGTCVLFFLTFMPYMQMLHSYRLLLLSAKVLFSILPNTLLAYSVQVILHSEASGIVILISFLSVSSRNMKCTKNS